MRKIVISAAMVAAGMLASCSNEDTVNDWQTTG